MKKNSFLIALFAGFIVIFSSCGSGPKTQDDLPPVKPLPAGLVTITRSETIPLYPERAASNDKAAAPCMEITLNLLTVTDDDRLGPLVNKLLYEGNTPQVYADNLIVEFKTQYAENRNLAAEYPDSPFAALNQAYTETIEAALYSPGQVLSGTLAPDLLTLSRNREYYLGGAHGMQETQYLVIDTAGARRLTLNDVIKPEARPDLQRRIEAFLRSRRKAPAGTPLSRIGYFEDFAPPPENFTFSPKGITFHWDPYEIAPYSEGPIEVTLPYGELAGLWN